VISYAGLQDIQNRYSKKLSGGEKQRLLFALSICGNPKLLFLDEPSVGMDVEARHGLWQAIRDLKAAGTGIVLTTHYLEEADNLADEIVLIKEGQVIRQGSSEAIKASISHTTIRFNYNEKPGAFAQLPGVVSMQPSGKFIQLHSQNVNQTLLALLSTYPNLQDLTVSSAGLEEAFLQLNGAGD
jgi:ABC-2 type transport system ATP-binding protein